MTKASTSHHEHHVTRAKKHAHDDAHQAVHEEAHALVEDVGPADAGTDPSDADAIALVQKLGLTGAEVRGA
jgi:hypothetical protein